MGWVHQVLFAMVGSAGAYYKMPPLRSRGQGALRAVEISKEVIGQGTYGVVYAARDGPRDLVAKVAREDGLSRKYYEIERAMNERVREACPEESLYVGEVELGSWPWTKRYLLFDRVPGGRDVGSYLADGACGIEALAGALGVEEYCAGAEECSIGEEDCRGDPEETRSGVGNAYVSARVAEIVLKSVARLHATGICHRDVKPANLLVDPLAQTIRIVDFGSAMDARTRLGRDEKRSPVSPRYCAPEQFVDSERWQSFDAYPVGVLALRILLSPALRSENDVDAFNTEFANCGRRLDAWLGSRLAATALSTKLLAPLSALRTSSPAWDREAASLWRLLAKLTSADPRERPDCASAAAAAADVRSALERAEAPRAATTFVPPPLLTSTIDEQQFVRATLAAPMRVGLRDTDDGVRIAEVFPGGSAEKLGVPAVGDRLDYIEWIDGRQTIRSVADAESALRRVSAGALFEVGVVEASRSPSQASGALSSVSEVGLYRRRGSGRSAVEDALAAFADDGFVEVVADRDWPSRSVAFESKRRTLPDRTSIIGALVADGHGGQDASAHCARRMPELVRAKLSSSSPDAAAALDAALLGAWSVCAAEYSAVDAPGGAVCAAALVSPAAVGVLHCGDCRVVGLDNRGGVLFETTDHQLANTAEVEALRNRGGRLEDGRVVADSWRVAVSRALGGRPWLSAAIAPVADAALFRRPSNLAALLLASDGLFGVFSSREAALYVAARRIFRPEDDAAQIAAHLCARAAALGSTDDVSAALILLAP